MVANTKKVKSWLIKAVEADKLWWHYCDIVPMPDHYDIGEY